MVKTSLDLTVHGFNESAAGWTYRLCSSNSFNVAPTLLAQVWSGTEGVRIGTGASMDQGKAAIIEHRRGIVDEK